MLLLLGIVPIFLCASIRRKKDMKRSFLVSILAAALLAFIYGIAFGWGRDGHQFINRKSVYHLPNQMELFIQDSSFFAAHASDADDRRSSDSTEGMKHFIDIDDYPNFQNLTRDLDSLIAQYGWPRVQDNGINPWATLWTYDSLVAQLSRGDWNTAVLTASDLGHYVGDAHQPLHNTVNYNGQLSGNSGIHSRYESTMINSSHYLSSLYITPGSVQYVADRINFIFDYVLHSNSLVDSIMHGDTYAKIASGWNGSGTPPPAYYTALWSRTGNLTLDQMQSATGDLAALWYSAWVDAGLITQTDVAPALTTVAEFSLMQNYPNPFNPTTTIFYHLPVGGTVELSIFTVDGKEISRLVSENQSAGDHMVVFDGSGLASGVYFYRVLLGQFSQTKKLLLVR